MALCLFLAFPSAGQKLGITKGFKLLGETFDPPHETQPRSLLEGATAQSLPGGNQLLKNVTLQTFNETGQRELLIKAPDCIYDRAARSATSAGPLRLQTADGKFSIEGEGFLWSQTNSSLFISNKVHTTIAPELLEKQGVETNRQTSASTGPLEIFADAFDYSRNTGRSFYRRNVRVSGTNQMGLVSQLLEIKLPVDAAGPGARTPAPKGMESIRAEKDVALDYSGVHATGQEALYATSNGIVRLTGQPAWNAEQRQGRGDELTVDRTNRIFRATGNAWFRTPAQGSTIVGLLDPTNAPSLNPRAATNHFIEVQSANYEFRTNYAVFDRGVRLKELVADQVRGTMNCELLSAKFAGSNQLETLTARTNVMIKDGTNWLSCGLAVLSGSNGVMDATQSPAWGAGKRSGKGELVRINTRSNEMLVRGTALLQLPAREFTDSSIVKNGTNVRSATGFSTDDFARIYCEEYTLAQESAHFHGGVYVTHPSMNWHCDSLSMQFPKTGEQTQTLVAEQNVKFQLRDEKGNQAEGDGEKAVYTRTIQGGITNEVLTLTGSPANLQTTNGVWHNTTIIYDRTKNQIHTPGNYSGVVTNKVAGTNLLILPKTKLTR